MTQFLITSGVSGCFESREEVE